MLAEPPVVELARPGSNPDARKKIPLAGNAGFRGVFFATKSRCRFLLMKYGGDRHIPGRVIFNQHDAQVKIKQYFW